jgi:NhaP-type Na+/H+ or K+/H+ antiporter
LSIAVILFEGGLSLRWEDVRAIRSVVRNIILLGALVTWVVSSLAAHWLLVQVCNTCLE